MLTRTNGLRVHAYLLNREASHTDLQITQKIDKRPFLGVHEALECAVTNYALFSAFVLGARQLFPYTQYLFSAQELL